MEQGPLNSLFKDSKLTITTSPKAIPGTNLKGRRSMIIKNEGSVTIFLGDSSVDTNGFKLNAGDEKPFAVGDDIILYGIVATGTAELRILEGA